MNTDEVWLAEAWRFVGAHIPSDPVQRVVEVGCGPFGGFVPMLRGRGHDAIGIDPNAPDGPNYARVEFERYVPPHPVDVVVASTSLHHVADVDEALDKIRDTLTPTGLVIVVEWAWERIDEATARWCFDRLDPNAEPGWLHGKRDGWRESGLRWPDYIREWAAGHGLHPSEQIRLGLDARFHRAVAAAGPYYFPELADTTASDEQRAIDAGFIRAGATYYVGALTPGG